MSQTTPYCFKVGIYADHTRDGTAIFSWADPACANGDQRVDDSGYRVRAVGVSDQL